MSKKLRWKWRDSNSNEPIERSPINANRNTTDKKESPSGNSNSPENIEYLDNFFDDKVNITTIKANPDVIINKTDAAVANPATRDATINRARNILVSNNITSQADVARLLDETKIRNIWSCMGF